MGQGRLDFHLLGGRDSLKVTRHGFRLIFESLFIGYLLGWRLGFTSYKGQKLVLYLDFWLELLACLPLGVVLLPGVTEPILDGDLEVGKEGFLGSVGGFAPPAFLYSGLMLLRLLVLGTLNLRTSSYYLASFSRY